MDVLLTGNDSSHWEGSRTGDDVQRRSPVENVPGKPNSIPGPLENCSASGRIPVRLQPGILFGINAESRSASPRNRVRLAPDSAAWPKTLSDFALSDTRFSAISE
jgi:hypothetical protein